MSSWSRRGVESAEGAGDATGGVVVLDEDGRWATEAEKDAEREEET